MELEGTYIRPKNMKYNRWIFFVISALFLIVLFLYEYKSNPEKIPANITANGYADITSCLQSDDIFVLPTDLDFYPNKLYSPEDFNAGVPGSTIKRTQFDNPSDIPYGTYVSYIQAEPNEAYLLLGYSLDYGMRLFCNDKEVIEIGRVADNADDAVPRIDVITVPVTSDSDGIIRLIIQYSNFVHRHGGKTFKWEIGSPASVMQSKQSWIFMNSIFGSGFIVLAIYFIYSSIINRNSLYAIISCLCLVLAFRNQNFFYGILLRRQYDWYLAYRVNLLVTMSEPYFIFYVLCRLIPEIRIKLLSWIVGITNFIFTCLMFILPTQVSSPICNTGIGFGSFYMVILFGNFVRILRRKKITISEIVLIITCILITVVGLAEIFSYQSSAFMTRSGMMSVVVFILLFVVKGIGDYKTRLIMREYRIQKDQANALEVQKNLRREFLANISHEMRTPLTVISGYAQRIQLKLRKYPEIEDFQVIDDSLQTIFSESQRLGTLVNQLLENSSRNVQQTENSAISLYEIKQKIDNLISPVLAKNSNKLHIHISDQIPEIRGNADLIYAILVNLAVNANRHSKSDDMVLSADYSDNSEIIRLSFTDHGDGMSPEMVEKVMTPGVSGDGSTGLGLPICAESMQVMGGTMSIESELGKGTTIKLFFKKFD